MVAEAVRLWQRIDVLHNNVGVSIAGGDAPALEITSAAFDRICAINLRGVVLACKHVLPVMRGQRAGAITNIASVAAWLAGYPLVAYKATKAAMIAYTEQIAAENAEFGVRANVILPGLIDTPMSVARVCAPRARRATRWRPYAMPKCRCAGEWAARGMWRTRRCFSPRMKQTPSPAPRCRWMAASACAWASPPAYGGPPGPPPRTLRAQMPCERSAGWRPPRAA